MNSFNFQIVPVANLAAIVTPFPDHICYFTEDTENYYIWENNDLKEIFVDTTSLTWNNITNKPTTISGFGITDAVKANNGAVDYVAKFTPDGTTIGNSQIRDNGTNIAIGSNLISSTRFYIQDETKEKVLVANSFLPGGLGINSYSQGIGNATNIGIRSDASNSSTLNIGIFSNAYSRTVDPSAVNIGIYAKANKGNPAAINYCFQGEDGSEAVGKYLKSVTSDGKANWANINITEVTNGLSSTLLGAPNGIATLDNNSKLVISQMPISVMDYKGTYDIVTNTPTLADGTGNQGDVYVCTTAGTRTFGPGNTITVGVGEWLIYNGTKWEKTAGNTVGSGTVTSVGLSLGTTGTDVNVSNSPITSSGNINLNIPTASASARGLLSTADWTTFNNKVSSVTNTLNYVTRFVGANQISTGSIQDSGTSVSIGNASPLASIKLLVANNGAEDAIKGYTNASGKVGVYGVNDGSGSGNNVGVLGDASSSSVINIGVKGNGSSGSGIGIGVQGVGQGSGTSIGLSGIVLTGANKYAIQLKDGTQASGKFLKCVNTNEGYANWANITAADVQGAVAASGGTDNYLPKFALTGTTLFNSQIQDNASTISINTGLDSAFKIKVYDSTAGVGLSVIEAKSGAINTFGIQGIAQGTTTGASNIGVQGTASGNSSLNIGVGATVTGTGTINIGIFSDVQGGTSKYSAQLKDGTQSENKFLKSVTNDGHANWAYLPDSAQIMCSDMSTPLVADAVNPKAYWVAPCNGIFTEFFMSFSAPQSGPNTVIVEIREKVSNAIVATLTSINGNKNSTVVTSTTSFVKYEHYLIYVTQAGNGVEKGLLVTMNYNRT